MMQTEKRVVENVPIHLCDSPEKIQMCLNCKKKKCTNCLGGLSEGRRTRRCKGAFYSDVKHELAEDLKSGISRREIAEKYEVHIQTISDWKRNLIKEGLL